MSGERFDMDYLRWRAAVEQIDNSPEGERSLGPLVPLFEEAVPISPVMSRILADLLRRYRIRLEAPTNRPALPAYRMSVHEGQMHDMLARVNYWRDVDRRQGKKKRLPVKTAVAAAICDSNKETLLAERNKVIRDGWDDKTGKLRDEAMIRVAAITTLIQEIDKATEDRSWRKLLSGPELADLAKQIENHVNGKTGSWRDNQRQKLRL